MPEISARTHLQAARSSAATEGDVYVTGFLIAGIVLAAAFVLWWAASSADRPRLRPVQAVTELVPPALDFEEHLAAPRDLLGGYVMVPVSYPERTAPGVTETMHQGWAQQWAPTDHNLYLSPSRDGGW